METPRLVAALVPWVWVIWATTSAMVVFRVWRRDIGPDPARKRAAWLLLGLSLLLFAGAFALPSRIDASGLMELQGGDTPWKGAVGEGIISIARAVLGVRFLGIIVTTRAFLPAAGLLAIAVACSALQRDATERKLDDSWKVGGVDLQLLFAGSALVLTPSFAFGVLGVFNFWFYGLLVLALLLALLELPRAPSWPARLSILCNLALIGFARPETIVAAVVAGTLIAISAFRRRDHRVWIPLAAVTIAMAGAAPSMFSYLDDRVRHQPLLMGDDTAADASPVSVVLLLIRRVAEHLPLNLLVLLVALHVLGALALVQLVRMVRTRRVTDAELAAVGLLLAEFLAIGVHREGFVRYIKYGQLVVVPVWFLCISGVLVSSLGRRRRRLLAAASIGALVLFAAHFALTATGVGRCATAEGKSRSGRTQDIELLWQTAPDWARTTCAERPGGRARVVIVQLDERGADPSQQRPPKPEGKSCEPERWPVWHHFLREGCATAVVIPARAEQVRETLCDPSEGVLSSPLRFESLHEPQQLPTHAVVTFYRTQRAEQIREALKYPACGWRIEEETASAMLLERVKTEAR
jgi:hypothetical protein